MIIIFIGIKWMNNVWININNCQNVSIKFLDKRDMCMTYISIDFVICNSSLYNPTINHFFHSALIKRDHTLDFCSSENLSLKFEKFFFVLSRIYRRKITKDQWYIQLLVLHWLKKKCQPGLSVMLCKWWHYTSCSWWWLLSELHDQMT